MPERENPHWEKFVGRALGLLPERPAPPGLGERVLAELARRAARPWWRRSYAAWPAWVRAAFFAACAAALAASAAGSLALSGRLGTIRPLVGLETGWAVAGILGRAVLQGVSAAFRAVPPIWLYGAAGALAAFYLAIVGLGAALCRALRSR